MGKKPKINFIKICGITDPQTAVACANSGADAIGLVFFKKSPRYVSENDALLICQALPSNIITTGVFVDEDFNFIMNRVKKMSLKAVQLHGNENPELIIQLQSNNVIVIKTIFFERKPYFKNAHLYSQASYLLAECGKGVLPGGNAKEWNWSKILQIKTELPVILAGGLNTTNINDAISNLEISGVDVSSGVELSSGIKDLNKVSKFIKAIKSQ